jgi:hypothetical protein
VNTSFQQKDTGWSDKAVGQYQASFNLSKNANPGIEDIEDDIVSLFFLKVK